MIKKAACKPPGAACFAFVNHGRYCQHKQVFKHKKARKAVALPGGKMI